MNILGLIPARGGSKGITKKNIRPLLGRPLIEYTIAAGLKVEALTDVVVSTDREEIAAVSIKAGATVPFLRPAHLATDTSPTIDTMVHLMEYYQAQGIAYDAVCLLQPTSPLRTAQDIDKAIEKFKQQQTDSLVSVIPVPHQYNPHWTFKVEKETDNLYLATGEKEIITRRQALPKAFIRNGAIYLTRTEVLLQKRSIYGDSIGYFEMEVARSVNIDDMEDWELAEMQLTMEINSTAQQLNNSTL